MITPERERTVAMLFALAATVVAQAPVRVADTAGLRAALAEAKPGAVIALVASDYDGFSAANVAGTARQPIVVRGHDAKAPPRFAGGIHLSDVAFVTLEDLLVEKAPHNGINIDDGGTADTPSHYVVLRRVVVRDTGSGGNHDGIKVSGVDDLRIEACTVERWGRGGSAIDMVGCHRVLIDGCTLRDRDEGAAATGVQAKGGSRDVTVRRCRFEHAGERAVNIGGSTGLQYFRPKPEGFEAKDVTVEGCTFVGSMAPIAFVGCDG
ncbi:MAG TPA: right-handed parallel beta-helix repeat-containing protein, partial [Planctomycetota bacterium]|nr:right-handed parallel beta-helix repeat-containing protein [Planctomycetota bacterium]